MVLLFWRMIFLKAGGDVWINRCQLLTQGVQNHFKYFLQLQLHSKHDVGTQNPENTPQTWNFCPLFLGKTCVMPHVCTLKKGKLPSELEFKRLWAWTWLHSCFQQSQQSKPWVKWKLSEDEQKSWGRLFSKVTSCRFQNVFQTKKQTGKTSTPLESIF